MMLEMRNFTYQSFSIMVVYDNVLMTDSSDAGLVSFMFNLVRLNMSSRTFQRQLPRTKSLSTRFTSAPRIATFC